MEEWLKRAFKQLFAMWGWCEDHVPGVRGFSRGVSEFVSNHQSLTFLLVIAVLSAIGLVYYDGSVKKCPKCKKLWAGTSLSSSAPEAVGSSFEQAGPFVEKTTETTRMTTTYRCRYCEQVWSRRSTSTSSRRRFDPYNP